MNQKIPHSPFTTRLSGSAKETELRLRSIFQWKKKRPPVILFILTAVLVLSCCGLVSCQVEPSEQSADVPPAETTPPSEVEIPPFSSVGLFNSYVTDFPDYTYTGERSATVDGRVITLEDAPENLAEEMVWNNYWLPFVGDYEPYTALMGSNHMRISAENEVEGYSESRFFSTVTVHALSVLTEQDYQPTSFYFSDETTANRFLNELWNDVHEYGLTEYTVVYVDLSWEWTQAALERGPQLGNGRYERLYLLGKTETDSDWKMYNIYWGDLTLGRLMSPAASVWQGDPIQFLGGDVTILPPESWKGKVGYKEGNGEITFYHLATSAAIGVEGAGSLCTVKYCYGEFYPLNYSFPWPGETIAMNEDGSYVYWTPSDVQFVPESEEEYTALSSRIGEIQFILSDNLKANSLNQENPHNPDFIPITRDGRTMVVTQDTVLTDCYSYTYSDPSDISSYHWFTTGTEDALVKGDIVLVLEEMDGRSRVVIPYGDVPWLYGFVDSDLLSDDNVTIRWGNQAIIAYNIAGYAAPGASTPSTMLTPCRVQRLDEQNGWVKIQPLGTGENPCWVDESHLSFAFSQAVIDAPPALNLIR